MTALGRNVGCGDGAAAVSGTSGIATRARARGSRRSTEAGCGGPLGGVRQCTWWKGGRGIGFSRSNDCLFMHGSQTLKGVKAQIYQKMDRNSKGMGRIGRAAMASGSIFFCSAYEEKRGGLVRLDALFSFEYTWIPGGPTLVTLQLENKYF